MIEIMGNIWDYYDQGEWICIPTNGYVKINGEAVMGAGLAKEAARRFPQLPKLLGKYLAQHGNQAYSCHKLRLLVFPTKHHWQDDADLTLIGESAKLLKEYVNYFKLERVYLPRVGCGLGRLSWVGEVCPLLETILDDNKYIVVRQLWQGAKD